MFSGSLPPVARHAQGILPTIRPPLKPYIISLSALGLNDYDNGGCGQSGAEGAEFGGDIQFTNNRCIVVAPKKPTQQIIANQGIYRMTCMYSL